MILKELKQQTADLHHLTEKTFYGTEMMSGTLTVQQYKDALQKNYYIFRRAEALYAEYFGASEVPRRTELLAKDLQNAGAEIRDFPVKPFVLENTTQCRGSMYVTEGSMLGGLHIGQKLAENKNLTAFLPLHFYHLDKKSTAKRWQEFSRQISETVTKPDEIEDAVIGAQRTFRFFCDVYRM